jgi:electron transport complex protein RnfB
MVEIDGYKQLALRLDALPNGYPATESGIELQLLAKIFTPEEAALAAQLRMTPETPAKLASRIGGDAGELRLKLKSMVKRGLITASAVEGGLGYALLPFVVGIYENQLDRIDGELAGLFEEYYMQAFGNALSLRPQVHRVIPVNESIRMDMEIQPYESVTAILDQVKSWGVMDCICRLQKKLVGEPCKHPIDVCLVMAEKPAAFDNNPTMHPLTRLEAEAVLRRAAKAGLVHSVSNNQQGTWYVCNCCTCACGILRGLADLGIANVIARSEFVSHVEESLCTACEDCVDYCQFDALTVDGFARVNQTRCVGCGVCVLACLEGALRLERRPENEIKPPPPTDTDWQAARAQARGISLDQVF